MTGIVHVAHPVPVVRGAAGGGRESVSFVRASVPARLREAEAGEFTFLWQSLERDGSRRFHERGGRLWTRLADGDDAPLSRARFCEWLSGAVPQDQVYGSDLHFQMHQTPLCASLVLPEGWDRIGTRGDALPEGTRVQEDMAEACGRAVRRFLDEDVVLVGDEVFLRSPGPLARVSLWPGPSAPVKVRRLPLILFPRVEAASGLAVRPDRLGQARKAMDNADGVDDVVRRAADAIPSDLLGDEDVRQFVNDAPRMVLAHAARASRSGHRYGGPEGAATLRRHIGEVQPWLPKGLLGMIGEDDHGEVIDAVARLARTLAGLYPAYVAVTDSRGVRTSLLDLWWFTERHLVPHMRGRQADPGAVPEGDDADALSVLAPGARP